MPPPRCLNEKLNNDLDLLYIQGLINIDIAFHHSKESVIKSSKNSEIEAIKNGHVWGIFWSFLYVIGRLYDLKLSTVIK